MLILIMYDISDDKSRDHISKYLTTKGLDRLQYSIFIGDLSNSDWSKIRAWLKLFFENNCSDKDRIYCIPQKKNLVKQMDKFGTDLDLEWIVGETKILYY